MFKINNKAILFILSFIIIFFSGIYIGRKTIKINEAEKEYIYIKGENITDSIPYPVPYEVIKPTDTFDIIKHCVNNGIYSELFPEKTITEYVEITKEDTSKIVEDWASKRIYSEKLFDNDTIGKCIINAEVQYNRLFLLSYEYNGVIKQITNNTNKVKSFSPYVGIGFLLENYTSNNIINHNMIPSLTLGFFIKDKYGINFQYGKELNNNNNLYGMSFLYKF